MENKFIHSFVDKCLNIYFLCDECSANYIGDDEYTYIGDIETDDIVECDSCGIEFFCRNTNPGSPNSKKLFAKKLLTKTLDIPREDY